MSENSPQSESSANRPQNTNQPPAAPDAVPEKTRKRKRWPFVIGGIVVVLLLLVLLAPTILSTGPFKSMALGVVNDNLDGKVEIADWSLGWNSGITVNGLKLYDDKGGLILQASRVRTELSIWKALTSSFTKLALGRTEVDNLDLTNIAIDPDGMPNVVKVAKGKKKRAAKPSSAPIQISGDIHVNNMTGNVTAAGMPQRVHINPSNLSVVLTGLNDPIKNDIQLAFTVEDPTHPNAPARPGSIVLSGMADLFDQDKLRLDTASVKEQLKLADVDVAAANPFLAIGQLKLTLAGLANGTVDVNLQGMANAAATGQIVVKDFVAGGEALNGDQFKSNLDIPIKITRVQENKDLVVLKVDDLQVKTDYGYVGITANASQESLQRLYEGNAPGREGHVTVMANFDQAAKLLNAMPRTLKLIDGVRVDSAKVFAQADGWIYADRVVSKTQFHLSDVSGTSKSGKIAISPIVSTLDVTYLPSNGKPFTITEVRDVGVALQSAFARIDGGTGKGGTLAQFTLTGNGDFAKLQKELAQFADLGGMDLAGTWNLKANTDGDPSKSDAAIKTNVQFTANNLTVKNFGKYPPIVQPWLSLVASGDVHLQDNAPRSITGGDVTLKSNNPNSPTVDLHASGDLDLKTLASDRFDVSVKALLAKARDEFAAFNPQLNYIESGELNASGAGSYDGKKLTLSNDKPLLVKLTGLALRQSATAKSPIVLKDQSLDANFAGTVNISDDELSADAKTISVTAPKLLDVHKNEGDLRLRLVKKPRQQLSGAGGLTIFADAKRLMDVYKSFAPPAAAPGSTADGGVGELARGLLNGSLTFTRGDQPVTTIAGNFTADVRVTTTKDPIDDKILITLSAKTPDDLTQQLTGNISVKSNILNAQVSDAVLVLAHRVAEQTTAYNSPLAMLQNAKISVTADRIDALQTILNGVMPAGAPSSPVTVAATPEPVAGSRSARASRERATSPDDVAADEGTVVKPLPPLRILGGKLAFNASVAHENQTTVLKDTSLDVTGLKFQRGDGYYASERPINLKLAAAIDAAQASVNKFEVRELSGDVNAGQIKLTKPIVVTNLASASPTVEGAVELQGQLADALRLLEAYQGAKAGTKYPYAGEYVLTQSLSTQGDTSRLAGTLKASKFKVYDPADPRKITFAEDLLTVTNDVAANPKTDTATIHNLGVNMQSTGALAVALSNGQLIDWANQRKIADKLQAHVRIDWPKFWTLVRPMLDPDTQKSFEDLELTGMMERDFTVSGSFPAKGTNRRGQEIALNTAQSLKFVNAYGGVKIERVVVSGLDVRDLELPITLEKGIMYIRDAGKVSAQQQRYPQAFACNGGSIDLGGVQVDLRHFGTDGSIVPWFTVPDANKVIMKNVAFNPLLAGSTIGNYVNPGFSGAQDARGRVTLTSVECKDVPLDWFTASKKEGASAKRDRRATSQSNGRAEFQLAISEMQLKAPLLPFLLKTDQLSGEVRNGKIIIENGIVKSDIPVELDMGGKAILAWSGSVNLQDRRILDFNTAIPKQLLADLPVLRNNEKLLPNVVNVPMSGSFDAPKIDLVAAVTKSLVPGIGSGKPEDLIKNLPDLINAATGKKDKKDKRDNRNDQTGDERISRDPKADGRDAPADGNNNTAKPEDNAVGDLLDIAGGLLNKNKKDKKTDERDMRDSGRDSRDAAPRGNDIGNERISNEPPRRITGDEPISADPRPARPATTAPSTTAPATQRNVSGRTRDARDNR
jgi:hypothetical protein